MDLFKQVQAKRMAMREAYDASVAILDRAQKAKRALTDGEAVQVQTHTRRFDQLKVEAEALETQRQMGLTLGTERPLDAHTRVATPDTWKDKHGVEVRSFGKDDGAQAVEEYVRQRAEDRFPGLTLGGFLRSMITGPRTESERRALGESAVSTGGAFVPTILSGTIIDRLRRQSVVLNAGAQVVPMTSEQLVLAKITGDPSMSWRGENAEVSESDPVFGSLVLSPRTLACIFRVPRELLEDAPNLERELERISTAAVALEIDRAAIVRVLSSQVRTCRRAPGPPTASFGGPQPTSWA